MSLLFAGRSGGQPPTADPTRIVRRGVARLPAPCPTRRTPRQPGGEPAGQQDGRPAGKGSAGPDPRVAILPSGPALSFWPIRAGPVRAARASHTRRALPSRQSGPAGLPSRAVLPDFQCHTLLDRWVGAGSVWRCRSGAPAAAEPALDVRWTAECSVWQSSTVPAARIPRESILKNVAGFSAD